MDQITPTADVFDDFSLIEIPAEETAALTVTLTTVPVMRPKKDQWIRVHPTDDPPQVALYYDENDGATYVVMRPIVPLFGDNCELATLHKAVTSTRKAFLLPCRVPLTDNESSVRWAQSLRTAVERAKKVWVQIKSDKTLGAYTYVEAPGDLGQPIWRPETSRELIKIAFRDRVISDAGHPVVQRLQGLSL